MSNTPGELQELCEGHCRELRVLCELFQLMLPSPHLYSQAAEDWRYWVYISSVPITESQDLRVGTTVIPFLLLRAKHCAWI